MGSWYGDGFKGNGYIDVSDALVSMDGLLSEKCQALPMIDILLKNFENPDEVRKFEKGKFELVKLPSMTIGRATYKPGWKWSDDISPLSETDFCG